MTLTDGLDRNNLAVTLRRGMDALGYDRQMTKPVRYV